MKNLKTIGDFSEGRKNNFDLIRFIAATMVLFSHCYPLSSGVKLEDPLARYSHFINFGGLGVYIFFMISGFLVTKSYCSRHDIINFTKARCLRIFPGLIAAMLFCTFIIGISTTNLSVIEYLRNRDTYGYVLHNILLFKIRYYLPGVFISNPYPIAVNGSLWTLPVEFKMYILVALIGLAGILKTKKHFNIFLPIAIIIYFILQSFGINLIDSVNRPMIIYFVLGSVVCINRNHIPVHPMILAILCILATALFKTPYFNYVFPIVLVYVIFFIAYYPSLKLNNFGKYGDFSYGMYIYAFPIQQLVASIVKNINPMELFIAAFILTLIAAVLSWHFVEKPAMKLKDKSIINIMTSRGAEA